MDWVGKHYLEANRGVRWRMVVGLVLLTLAGCSDGGPLPPTPVSVQERAGAGQGVMRIGLLTPMSGELATFGEASRNGIRLALDQWNERGGVAGRPVQWVVQDTDCDPETSRQDAENLIDAGIDLLIGGLCSESAIAVATVAQERNALFVAIAATHPRVTVDGDNHVRPTVFRVAYELGGQGRAAAHFLEQQGLSQAVVVLDEGDPFDRALTQGFMDTWEARNGVAEQVPFSAIDTVDWNDISARIDPGSPLALYVPGRAEWASAVSRKMAFALVLGSDAWRRSGEDLSDLDGAHFTDVFDAGSSAGRAGAWSMVYQTGFAQEPDALAMLGYEAADVLCHASDLAGNVTVESVSRELETLAYDGVVGDWHFDDRHDSMRDFVVVRLAGPVAEYAGTVRQD